MNRKRISRVALAACAALIGPALAALPAGASPGGTLGEEVSFQVNQEKSPGSTVVVLLFSGRLTWSGEGNRTYRVAGTLQARCSIKARSTAWLQYGGTGEKWKDSEETACSEAGSSWRDITVTGTLAPNQDLELRLGSWKFASWKYSEAKTYTPAAVAE
ncbi:hypothetical protein ACFVGM_34270 [Kitasatospora purpeofusca]|uniref:hypothetical protein n=1 Tax=Kitasatospora purpeofusca TaxID=67352 RepID=UPI00368A57F4